MQCLNLKNISLFFCRKSTYLKTRRYIYVKMINIEKKPTKKKTTVQTIYENENNILLLNENNNVENIYFLSDIHIKNEFCYHEKYISAFDNTIKTLKEKNISKNDLICILGDIMDIPDYASSSALLLVDYLFKKLLDFCDVIVMVGNHDVKKNKNKNEEDLIVSILKNMQKTKNNIYFLLDDAVYIYGNIAFGHTKFENTIKPTACNKSLSDKYICVSMYHGIINGSSLDNNEVGRSCFSLKDFSGYQYFAFGDIHKHQWLNKIKTAFYPGSLLANKRNDSPTIRGFVKLNVVEKKTEFCQIINEYKILDLFAENKEIYEKDYNTGKMIKCDIDELLKNTKNADVLLTSLDNDTYCIEYLKTKLKNKNIETTFTEKKNPIKLGFGTSIKIGKKNQLLSELSSFSEFIKFYFLHLEKSKYIIKNKINFTNLVKRLMFVQNKDPFSAHRELDILSIKINNIMSYGTDVILNVGDMTGIYGMCETNSSGKSTICEVISLILFGKTPRCKNINSFIRNNEKKCSGTIKLTSNNVVYEIERIIDPDNISRSKDQVYIKKYVDYKKNEFVMFVNYQKIAKDLNCESINTDEFIEKEIIGYDEIYEMVVISQDRYASFFKNDKQVEMLFKITNLSFFNTLMEQSSKLLSSHRKKITEYIKEHVFEDFKKNTNEKTSEEKVEKILNVIDDVEKRENKKMMDMENEHEKMKNEYEQMLQNYVKCKTELETYSEFSNINKCNIDDLVNDIEKCKKKINYKNENELKNVIKINEVSLEMIKLKYDEYSDDIEIQNAKFINQKNFCLLKKHEQVEKLKKKLHNNVVVDEIIDIVDVQRKMKENVKCLNDEYKKLELSSDKNLFNNYKQYCDAYIEVKSNERLIELYDSFLHKNTIFDKQLSCEIEIVKNNNKNNKIKLESLIVYKDAFELINNVGNVCLTIDKLKNEHKLYEKSIDDNKKYCENCKINLDIQNLQSEINDINEYINIEYNEYNKLYVEYDQNIKFLETLKMDLNIVQNENVKLENEIEKKTQLLKKITDDNERYQKFCMLNEKFDYEQKQYNLFKSKYEKFIKDKENEVQKSKKLLDKCLVSKSVMQKCDVIVDEIRDLIVIENSFVNNGLGGEILKYKIVPTLQNLIDEMCVYIGHEKINIQVTNAPKTSSRPYDLIITTENSKDIANCGGFQYNIIELLFKLAFLQMNSYFKTNFIIIDEIFDKCSDENKILATKLVDYFKTQYNKILLVSHNSSIINMFDKRIIIKKNLINGNDVVWPF